MQDRQQHKVHIVPFTFRLATSAKDEVDWGRSANTLSRPREDDIDINGDNNTNVNLNRTIDPHAYILNRNKST